MPYEKLLELPEKFDKFETCVIVAGVIVAMIIVILIMNIRILRREVDELKDYNIRKEHNLENCKYIDD